MDKIRNFCIIAHIDHGKSTLADRMMELSGTVQKRDMKAQLLDSMELEREKGITIKLAPVRMKWRGYELNLIDTPGHVDFSYEVSRSLAAVEGAILVVDASQGVQAQTLANVYLAMDAGLMIIPVLNKVDLPAADVPRVSREVSNLLGCDESEIIAISAKSGLNVGSVLDAVIEKIPSPLSRIGGDSATPAITSGPAQALIFDSYFDDYRGVVLYVRIFGGEIKTGDEILMMANGKKGLALEVGCLTPKMQKGERLQNGEIGYIVTNLKTTRDAKVGDTVTLAKNPAEQALPGYKNVLPFVYAGFFTSSNEQYKDLKEAIERLALSDSALVWSPENSPVLGQGLRIGFLGLLHLDIIKERLEREFDLDLIITNPSTDYKVTLTSGEQLDIKSASELPEQTKILEIREPFAAGEIIVPKTMTGAVIDLVVKRRGAVKNISYLETGSDAQALLTFEAPIANLLTDFYDRLKSSTSGYGTFNYELADYRAGDLVRVDFYVGGEMVDALSVMAHRSEAVGIAQEITKKLKEVVPRQAFEVALQGAIGAKFIARETIGAYRKDVLTKIHTGDRDRKAKLLSKQKKGKARMKRFGKVDIPSEAFTLLLKR
ncbi:MAG: translation elongation factor 4 [Candidatus Nomurabacteria bacterium]|jgi:GTP-binding protein LepA|nr:translation elongation factor 4 [Candidatus Nomurabacteria bacterium]